MKKYLDSSFLNPYKDTKSINVLDKVYLKTRDRLPQGDRSLLFCKHKLTQIGRTRQLEAGLTRYREIRPFYLFRIIKDMGMRLTGTSLITTALIALAVTGILFTPVTAVLAAQRHAAGLPKIDLYTQPGCKSCTAASDYMTSNKIPFTKKDIAENPDYLEELSHKYRTRAVPVIVIGNDEKVLRGYVQEAFQLAVREVLARQKN
jgi:glutaredoxin